MEVNRLAEMAGVDPRAVQAAMRLIRSLPDAIEQGKRDPSQIVANTEAFLQSAGFKSTDISLVRDIFAACKVLIPRFVRIEEIEKALPCFRTCHVACDIRLLQQTGDPKGRYGTVAIVRLGLDEGPLAGFQCTRESLGLLVECLRNGLNTLTELERVFEAFGTRSVGAKDESTDRSSTES
ncbi:MAG: hypothetical protein AB1714_15830 [Acidobacteriota bacterium]